MTSSPYQDAGICSILLASMAFLLQHVITHQWHDPPHTNCHVRRFPWAADHATYRVIDGECQLLIRDSGGRRDNEMQACAGRVAFLVHTLAHMPWPAQFHWTHHHACVYCPAYA